MIGSLLQIFCIVGIFLVEKHVHRSIVKFEQSQADLLDDDRSSLYCYRFESAYAERPMFDAKNQCFPIRLDHQAPSLGRWPRALCVVASRALERLSSHQGLEQEAKRCP